MIPAPTPSDAPFGLLLAELWPHAYPTLEKIGTRGSGLDATALDARDGILRAAVVLGIDRSSFDSVLAASPGRSSRR